eukprot:CAMPEP_0172444772 /NCGR_PEP_ID=MMETSP1065-20121228/4788_1 /TAXON_ID=265537 /ORGANISM="Amphiprora paludosa, Strain CCMP125" /LENGTH=348 /DNA_ID=CAMNT_0013195457 /DNA_START=24 /DNA_END=1070 /DNA_ORIENTATION=+
MRLSTSTRAIMSVLSLFWACDVSGLSSTTAFSRLPSLETFDYTENNRLPWIESGYGTWKWNDEHDINYLEMGDPSKPALLLIHGFGASAYHFRYNIPELARDYHVFAFDKLGFGLSAKPILDYSAELWRDQTVDFIQNVIGKPVTVAGNSIGGFTALYTAATADQDLIKGCILLNAAGGFKDPQADQDAVAVVEEEKKNPIIESILAAIQRAVIAVSFVVTKQPARIQQVLKQVYPVNADNVDDELVESIQFPAQDPNAAEVFYRVIARNGNGANRPYVDDLLEKLNCPLLLCWGEYDPWIRPAAADRIQELYPASQRVSIDGGHCPHDENPAAVNQAISSFLQQVAA